MYLPLAALVALAVGAALELGTLLTRAGPVSHQRRVRVAGGVATALLATAFAATTYARNSDYASAIALWQSSATARPKLAQGLVNLGIAHAEVGAYREAAASYRRALELEPDVARAHYDLALALERLGESDAGIAHYERAVALEPRFEAAQLALARARLGRGDADAAAAALRSALEAVPHGALLHLELAQLLLSQGDSRSLADALLHAREASTETGGRDPAVLHTLAAAEWASGLRAQAVQTQERALGLAVDLVPELASRLAEQLERYRSALAR